MIAKFICDLNEDELLRFHESTLWDKAIAYYAYEPVHIEYYKIYFGNTYKDYSIVVFDKSDFYICSFAFTNNNIYSFFGSPVHIMNIQGDENILNVAFNDFFTKLHTISVVEKIYIYDHNRVTFHYFEKLEFSKIFHQANIALSLSEANIRMNVRKSYKSLINWGYKNLQIQVLDYSNITIDKFESFHRFHIEVAGRVTRSNESWTQQYNAICQKKGTLVLGYLNNVLVSGVYTAYGKAKAYYGVAVNNRDLMAQHLPIGHVLLIEAILKAKQDGLEQFILGDVAVSGDEKLDAIAKYKRGFTNSVDSVIVYRFDL